MSENALKRKLWALHIGGESLSKMLQSKIEIVKGVDNSDVLVGGAGFTLTLDMMVRVHSKNKDAVFEELLPMLPMMAALGDWLKKIPKYEATEDEFEGLMRMGHVL